MRAPALPSRGLHALAEDAIDPAYVRSWTRAWTGLSAQGNGIVLRDQLLEAWAEPQREYHTLRHLRDCLVLFEEASGLAVHPGEVEIALWFHDAVYDLKAKDNEARSAAWAGQALIEAGVGPEVCVRVHQLIMATCHAALPTTPDQALVVDIDLSILGAEPERFDEYEVQVRQADTPGCQACCSGANGAKSCRLPGSAAHLRNDVLPGAIRGERAREPAAFDRAPEAVAGTLVNSDRDA